MYILTTIIAILVGCLAIWYIIRYFWTKSVGQLEEVNVGQNSDAMVVKLRQWMNQVPKNDYVRLSHINSRNSLPNSSFGFRFAQGITVGIAILTAPLIFVSIVFLPLPFVFLFLGLFYMPYYCKQIIAERELEWYKSFNLYHEIAIEAETDVMSSVFFRLEPSIKSEEVREGIRSIISDVNTGSTKTIDDYPFPIVRKFEKIVRDLENGDGSASSAIRGFYQDTYRDYKFRIVKILAQTANKAVASTLPFLMVSLVIALLIPLVVQFLQNM